MLLNDISNYFYAVTEDYLIRTSKSKKFKRKLRKVEPILEGNGKNLGNNLDLYA